MAQFAPSRRDALFSELFRGYTGPVFALRLWDGWRWCSSGSELPVCTIVLNNPKSLASILAAPSEVSLGEAFIHGDLDVEGDLFSVFPIAEHLFDRPCSLTQKVAAACAAGFYGLGKWLQHGRINSQRRDHASIAYHYDQPAAFFEPWLGKAFVYSCAFFHSPDEPLDAAQERKMELVCRKLRLQPSEDFLDIGCGWGSLLLHAAQRHGVHAQGITISREQAETARLRIERAGLEPRCAVQLCDYRELEGAGRTFDKIASIGMFEHVGLRNLPRYFGIAYRLLRPGGVFLNHGIARSPLAPVRSNSFIDRYVFPDGRLTTLSQAITAAESQGLEVRDVENLREHYDLTLQRWVAGLRQNADTLLRHIPLTTYRIWLLYMAGSAAAFRRGAIGVYQVLLSRPDHGRSRLPLTRQDWYRDWYSEPPAGWPPDRAPQPNGHSQLAPRATFSDT